jgi:hypothetical protein
MDEKEERERRGAKSVERFTKKKRKKKFRL